MCGIVGFTGAAQAAPILLDGLAKLEYRGYDSAGLAVQNAAGKIEVVKAKGRLKVLSEMTDGGMPLQAPAASAIPVGPLTASLLWSMRTPITPTIKKLPSCITASSRTT